MQLFEILKEYDGIIGTVIGVVVTFVVTNIMHKRGKIKTYITSVASHLDTYRDVSCGQKGKTEDDIYGYGLKYCFQLYNAYEYPKVIREFSVEFYTGSNLIMKITPRDEETRIVNHAISHAEKATIANIPAHEIMEFRQSVYVGNWEENFEKLDGITKIKLAYYDEDNKRHEQILLNERLRVLRG